MPTIPLPAPGLLAFVAFDAFRQSDFVGRAIVVILVAVSVVTGGIILSMFGELKRIAGFNQRFLDFYRRKNHPLAGALDGRLANNCPMMRIYNESAKLLIASLERSGMPRDAIARWTAQQKDAPSTVRLPDAELAAARGAAERIFAEEQTKLESRTPMLSVATSIAPSLGLFGTVWGVMVAFMAMGTGGSSMISSVAPGISGALLTTVVGLVVAVPASIFYNIIVAKIQKVSVDTENFLEEFMSDVSRIHSGAAMAPADAAPAAPAQPQVAIPSIIFQTAPAPYPAQPAPPVQSPAPLPLPNDEGAL